MNVNAIHNDLSREVPLTALNQSFNAVLVTDANGGPGGNRIFYVNAAFCDMTGYSEIELLVRNV